MQGSFCMLWHTRLSFATTVSSWFLRKCAILRRTGGFTSGPHHQSTHKTTVKITKQLLRYANRSKSDAYLTLLDYRDTLSQDMNCSPLQRLMGRWARRLFPNTTALLRPYLPQHIPGEDSCQSGHQVLYHNCSATDLPPLVCVCMCMCVCVFCSLSMTYSFC